MHLVQLLVYFVRLGTLGFGGPIALRLLGGTRPFAAGSEAAIKDGEVSARCKSVSGTVDQACGIVWRYRDPENYYIVRANALENNVVLYKVESGKGSRLLQGDFPQIRTGSSTRCRLASGIVF